MLNDGELEAASGGFGPGIVVVGAALRTFATRYITGYVARSAPPVYDAAAHRAATQRVADAYVRGVGKEIADARRVQRVVSRGMPVEPGPF